MSVFDYGDGETEENSQESKTNVVSACDSGSGQYTTLRMTIPKEVCEEHDIGNGDSIAIEKTDDGFAATVLGL